jgi:hypothetical protein
LARPDNPVTSGKGAAPEWAPTSAVAEAYSPSPERASELKNLLSAYAGSQFGAKLSERLHFKME